MPKVGLGGHVPMHKSCMPLCKRMDAHADGRALAKVSMWPAFPIEALWQLYQPF